MAQLSYMTHDTGNRLPAVLACLALTIPVMTTTVIAAAAPRRIVTNTAKATWSVTGSLHDARSRFTSTLLPDGRVLVVGGTSNVAIVQSAEIFNPRSRT